MCGIFGIWNRDGRPVDLAAVRAAVEAIDHRGPDDEGYLLVDTSARRTVPCGGADTPASLGLPRIEEFVSESFDMVIANRRLAILDVSPAGHQPMGKGNSSLWAVHNGEIYNFLELRSELAALGHRFETESDTEVLLAAYRQWGPSSLDRFVGMWATVLYDAGSRRLFASRDRFGIKPLTYVLTPDTFAFASESKALLQVTGPPAVDNAAVFDYLALGLVNHSERTFFQGISSLRPGHTLTVSRDAQESRRFWDLAAAPEREHAAGLSDQAAGARFRELLSDSVRLHLRSDAPVGTCLSGGLDSSSIVCLVSRLLGERGFDRSVLGDSQKTFTASFDDPSVDERRYAEAVIAATGADAHFTRPRAGDLMAAMPRLVWHQEEPFPSTSMYAQWCVMELAAGRGIKVLLDGQGADEMLAGYPVSLAPYLGQLAREGRLASLYQEAGSFPGGRAAGLARALVMAAPIVLRSRVGRLRGEGWPPWLDPDFVRQHAGAHLSSLRQGPDLRAALMRQMEVNLPALLRFEDRNSMAFGVEARVPFLDHRLVSFVFAIDDRHRILRGWTKPVLRRAMRGIVPDQILSRREKIGFVTPQVGWLREIWPDLREVVLSRTFRDLPYFDHGQVSALGRRFDEGGSNASDASVLWSWVSLGLWVDRFLR